MKNSHMRNCLAYNMILKCYLEKILSSKTTPQRFHHQIRRFFLNKIRIYSPDDLKSPGE